MWNKFLKSVTSVLAALSCIGLMNIQTWAYEDSTEVLLNIPESYGVSLEIQGNGTVRTMTDDKTEEICQNGSIQVSKGDELVIFFVPAKGYRLAGVTYQGIGILDQIQNLQWSIQNVQEAGKLMVFYEKLQTDAEEDSSGSRVPVGNTNVNTGDSNSGFAAGVLLLAATCAATALAKRKYR